MNQTASITDSLLELGILSEADTKLSARLEQRSTTDRAFVTELHRRGKLTRLQAIQVGRGRAHHLVIGPYVLLDRLGSGGMGRVFLGRHNVLGRLTALKLVRFDRRKCAATRSRFLREVRLIGLLNHENVVHALDAGTAHGAFYLAMEYVPGPDLGRVLAADVRLDAVRACEYARQAALGLQHIHDRGLVHRDVKPSNLSLGANGRTVKVLDVGLARRCNKVVCGSGISHARRLIGSPDYASPEQVLDSRRADPRADLYALGCTLYHMLAGRVPFPGGTPVAKALRHLSETPRPIEELRRDLPIGLGDVLRKLMARCRKHRYRTAAEAAAALSQFAKPFDPANTVPLEVAASTDPTAADWPTDADSE